MKLKDLLNLSPTPEKTPAEAACFHSDSREDAPGAAMVAKPRSTYTRPQWVADMLAFDPDGPDPGPMEDTLEENVSVLQERPGDATLLGCSEAELAAVEW